VYVHARAGGRPHRPCCDPALAGAARDALGETRTAESAVERALDLAEPDGALYPFLFHPAPGLLERHSRHHTSHASRVEKGSGAVTSSR
jgi:hypothetical protein